ncbi:polymeric immunoglobulin receptor [Danio aesculapii]|uniref:polymeric immunoglobulin receptor n=1 Tax=Danio aesculapii TaxID=1142201 RepID=UPI0024BF5BAF|nr:polymeric immunoglobulin receptor [Danio aesculapii]
MKIIWTFTLLMIPDVLSSISVTGYSGGGVTITFKYNKAYETDEKYLCKGEGSECKVQIRMEAKHQWVQSGRFSLYDNTTAGVFTVTIRDLTEQDSGIYYCGTEVYGPDPKTKVNLKVITEFRNQVNTNSGKVRGYSGGNITIDYKYEEKHKNREKLVCKSGEHQCATLISISRSEEWKHSSRFSIHDDRSAGLLRVFIREMNVHDSGEYRIIERVSEDYSLFSEFELVITHAACCQKSISLSAAAGGSVNISCKYPQSHTADVKFICRRSGADLCAEETRSEEESGGRKAEGKIRLYDDREEQLLTATISHESPEHSAEYWCGVQSAGHKSFITRVIISFTDADVSDTTSSSPSSSSPSSSSSVVESPLQTMCVRK